MVFRGVELASIDRAHHHQLIGLRVQVRPLESETLTGPRDRHSMKPNLRAVRFLERANEFVQMLCRRELFLFTNLLGWQICIPDGVLFDVAKLHGSGKDRTEPPFQVLQCVERLLFFRGFLVDKGLNLLGIDFGQRPGFLLRSTLPKNAQSPRA